MGKTKAHVSFCRKLRNHDAVGESYGEEPWNGKTTWEITKHKVSEYSLSITIAYTDMN